MNTIVFKNKEKGASRHLSRRLLLFIAVSMSKCLSSSDGCALCQVSLDEGAGASVEDEVLQRAAGFFVDNNENYTVYLFFIIICIIIIILLHITTFYFDDR